ncbi:MAG: hypothetical protein L6Q97_10680 [Thermoanaerobaculia bacterium]|nr:hypothetical protein [Thermoanaerobaculia bacterium]
MKILNFALSMLVSVYVNAQAHFSAVIGTMSDGVPTITYDLTSLKQQWQSVLDAESSVQVVFTNVSIKDEGSYFVLVGFNEDDSTKAVIELVLEGNSFYELSIDGGGRTVSCSGCNVGCHPKKAAGEWQCLPSCGYNECTKTETITTSKAILDNSGN